MSISPSSIIHSFQRMQTNDERDNTTADSVASIDRVSTTTGSVVSAGTVSTTTDSVASAGTTQWSNDDCTTPPVSPRTKQRKQICPGAPCR